MAKVKIPITKAKAFIEVNTDDPSDGGDLPPHVYAACLEVGIKHYLNGGMTKITTSNLEGEELEAARAAALAKGEENLKAMREGKIRIVGAKTEKISGKVMTEARRLARSLIKDEMKRHKIKLSHVLAKDITAAANAYLASEDGKELIEQAKASVEAQSKKVEGGLGIDISALIPIDEKKKAQAEAKRKEAKTQLSALQAGKVAPRARPQA
jgi:hypothetical protein